MDSLLLFLLSYTVLFILYLIFFYLRGVKKNKKSIYTSIQVQFLKIRFEFKNKELPPKKMGLIVTFIDPLIISLTGTIVSLPKWHYIVELLIGFVLLLLLIFSFYEIIGRILKRKVDKNV